MYFGDLQAFSPPLYLFELDWVYFAPLEEFSILP
jgi:hypothetical protein